MAIPPKGDIRRPLHLAVRSTFLLGIVLLAASLLSTASMFLTQMRGATRFAVMTWGQIIEILFFFGPGIAYLLCAMYLRQRKMWALIVAIVLVTLQLLWILLMLRLLLTRSRAGSLFDLLDWIPLILLSLIVAALIQVLVLLSKSIATIEQPPIDIHRGFEPLATQRATIPPIAVLDQPNVNDLPK